MPPNIQQIWALSFFWPGTLASRKRWFYKGFSAFWGAQFFGHLLYTVLDAWNACFLQGFPRFLGNHRISYAAWVPQPLAPGSTVERPPELHGFPMVFIGLGWILGGPAWCPRTVILRCSSAHVENLWFAQGFQRFSGNRRIPRVSVFLGQQKTLVL